MADLFWFGWQTPAELAQQLDVDIDRLCKWLIAAVDRGVVLPGRLKYSAVSVPVFRWADQKPPAHP